MLERKGLINFGARAEEGIHYNCGEFMQSLIGFGIYLLEGLFVVGLAGSTLVLVVALKQSLVILMSRSSDVDD